MQRSAKRLARLLACAAVPVMLIAGCSSGSDSSGKKTTGSGAPSGSGSTSASAAPAKLAKLPEPCKAITQDTVSKLVPKVKAAAGTPAKAAQTGARGGCSWTGNGDDGFQFRWLEVSLQRYDSVTGLGSAEERARKRYSDQVTEAGRISGAQTTKADGVGDEATVVSAVVDANKMKSQNETVIARTGNVVVVIDYNGAGLEGKKNPTADDMQKGALTAAKDAIASVTAANK